MEFFPISSDIKKNVSTFQLFENFKVIAEDREGYCYHKYPIAGGTNGEVPEIVIIDKQYGVCAIDLFPLTIDRIQEINDDEWTVDGKLVDSPLLKLEDYSISLSSKFQKHRPIRNKVMVNTFLVLPLITRNDFNHKYPRVSDDNIIFSDFLNKPYEYFWPEKSIFNEEESKLFISVSQGAGKLNTYKKINEDIKGKTIGEAINLIDTRISELDKIQHAAAVQIPDGPQRIRGMAGTGKTIILTMKAAFLHSKYPNAKILYTFHTQSLYSQIKNLITKFYRDSEEKDPNWDNLLVLHSWGGKAKEGVYSRTCMRNSLYPIPYFKVRHRVDPFDYVCQDAIQNKLLEEFDFVLMDESQDLPASFFQLIYKITKDPKRIIFAYDELQTLSDVATRDTGELFGYASNGEKLVDFSPGEYDGGIEMDFVLQRSYRNPLEILMVAHGIGLGLYNTDGFMQVIEDKSIWNAIGYNVIEGEFHEGEQIVIERPKENSISVAHDLYEGNSDSLIYKKFDNRIEEIEWIRNCIKNDIENEDVQPHHIIVVALDAGAVTSIFPTLQNELHKVGIPSIIPGVGGAERDMFSENGFVTLSTVYKAKGNEAFVVYVMNFDYLYDYVDFVQARNRAFTSITRAKGWCRISGIGEKMDRAIVEIDRIVDNIPKFIFPFPNKDKIARKLSQEEHARRLQEMKKAKSATQDILEIDEEAIENISVDERTQILEKLMRTLSPEEVKSMLEKLK